MRVSRIRAAFIAACLSLVTAMPAAARDHVIHGFGARSYAPTLDATLVHGARSRAGFLLGFRNLAHTAFMWSTMWGGTVLPVNDGDCWSKLTFGGGMGGRVERNVCYRGESGLYRKLQFRVLGQKVDIILFCFNWGIERERPAPKPAPAPRPAPRVYHPPRITPLAPIAAPQEPCDIVEIPVRGITDYSQVDVAITRHAADDFPPSACWWKQVDNGAKSSLVFDDCPLCATVDEDRDLRAAFGDRQAIVEHVALRVHCPSGTTCMVRISMPRAIERMLSRWCVVFLQTEQGRAVIDDHDRPIFVGQAPHGYDIRGRHFVASDHRFVVPGVIYDAAAPNGTS